MGWLPKSVGTWQRWSKMDLFAIATARTAVIGPPRLVFMCQFVLDSGNRFEAQIRGPPAKSCVPPHTRCPVATPEPGDLIDAFSPQLERRFRMVQSVQLQVSPMAFALLGGRSSRVGVRSETCLRTVGFMASRLEASWSAIWVAACQRPFLLEESKESDAGRRAWRDDSDWRQTLSLDGSPRKFRRAIRVPSMIAS